MRNVGRPRLYTPEEAVKRKKLTKQRYADAHREEINSKKAKRYQAIKDTSEYKALSAEQHRKFYAKNRTACIESATRRARKPLTRYTEIKSKAKTRNLEFSLTYQEFLMFDGKPCYYCDSPKVSIGLDRTDNTKGYTLSNVVACCKQCNIMKQFFSKQAFIERCQLVSKNFTKKGDNLL